MPEEKEQGEILEQDSPFSDVAIHDLIGQPPGWILKSGILIVFFVVIVMIAFCMVIRFPDRIQAVAVVTTENPPIEIVAKGNGKIEKLFVEDQQKVQKGDLVAYFENTTKAEDVKRLQQFLKEFDLAKNSTAYLAINFPENIALGSFQVEGTTFEQRFNEYKYFLQKKGSQAKILALGKEVEKIQSLNKVSEKEKGLLQQEQEWNRKETLRFKSLKEQKTVSDSEYEKKELDYIRSQRLSESLEKEMIRNQIRIDELHSRQMELAEDRKSTDSEYRFALIELKNRVANKIREWEDRYFLRAPVSGTCNVPVELVENTVLNSGEALAFIVPGNKAGEIIAQAKVSITGIGKIDRGDRTLLRLDPYPYKEFGSVESKVGDISLMPQVEESGENRFYTVTIPIGKTIETDYHKEIPYRPNMSGTIHIITKDKSLFYRIFEQFIRLVKD